MYKTETNTETRQVRDFDQVSIRGNMCSAQLFITQGESEGLSIEAPPTYLHRLRSEVKNGKLYLRLEGSWRQQLEDALSTSLNRPPLIYRLAVRELTGLEVQCADIVHSSRLETPNLQIKWNGTGDFKLDWLAAERLAVHHTGAGALRITGQVAEQTIVLNGVGSYLAPRLESQCAGVRMTGMGSVRIQVSQALDATLRGGGYLEYSGFPTVSKRVSGPGRVIHVPQVKEQVT